MLSYTHKYPSVGNQTAYLGELVELLSKAPAIIPRNRSSANNALESFAPIVSIFLGALLLEPTPFPCYHAKYMSDHDIPKTYDPTAWEHNLYRKWEESGFFNPGKTESDERYCNVLPPPNANGELHLGHASGYTVMDILGRFERMKGKKTVLLPGKDHAGIQTQVVFEKKLHADRGITRHDLGRGEFYKETYAFCMDRASYMRSQEKRIGLSADWSREMFTLDPSVSEHVRETFVKMYKDGMIYRGERIINWCPRCTTALSDIEVVHKETDGKLFFITYPIKNSDESITVATTRPETMLGDTAVAVYPDDERYRSLVGKMVIIPLVGREIPIIADKRIDPAFGTGAVKITPANDPLDWEIGKTHELPVVSVIGTDAKITSEGGVFSGLSVEEARTKVLDALKEEGALESEEPHTINRSSCERCRTAIEPLVSKQWFVNVDAPAYSLKQRSIEAIRSGAITFYPESMKEQMVRWLENLHDWCISRQLWWGHQIPVWYRELPANDTPRTSRMVQETYCGINPPEDEGWKQDPDTLDTWFSSGQWPYTTLGYPNGDDFKNFYPTDTMVMGRDLLFFWATRMIMLGLYRTGDVPFRELYFTGLVRDKDGHKMSKSKGTGIDVLEMIDRYGADAVRLSLTIGTTPGLDFHLSDEKIAAFRNFTNKLWNIGRYVGTMSGATTEKPEVKSSADRWILGRLGMIAQEVTRLLENRQVSLAGETLRAFTWDDFADWYVEAHKVEKNDALLRDIFGTILKLWHPFMPFVTEATHETLKIDENEFLMISRWPAFTETGGIESNFEDIRTLITRIRNLRSVYHINPGTTLTVSIETELLDATESIPIIEHLARASVVDSITGSAAKIIVSEKLSAHVSLKGIIDIKKEKERLEDELANADRYAKSIEAKLGNPAFTDCAPKEIVKQTQTLLKETRKKFAELSTWLESIQ